MILHPGAHLTGLGPAQTLVLKVPAGLLCAFGAGEPCSHLQLVFPCNVMRSRASSREDWDWPPLILLREGPGLADHSGPTACG